MKTYFQCEHTKIELGEEPVGSRQLAVTTRGQPHFYHSSALLPSSPIVCEHTSIFLYIYIDLYIFL